jgi:2-desacetyl-2-hydroxyethyl bacteriochlorophyllide A dehydrogenase
MKAIVQHRYGSADVLELRDIDKPMAGDDELLVRVHAAGVDPGVWHFMTGLPYMIRLGFGFRAPKVRVRGWDLAGRVEAVGKNVTKFKPGDEVFGTGEGTFAEYACAREDRCAPRPANLTLEQAAAVSISACTALQGLRDKGRVRPGQKVLVIGAGGGVGTFAVQLAKAFGAEVTAVCSTSKADLVRSIGASDVIDYTRDDFADGMRRYDLILDTAGNRPLLVMRRALTPHGALVIIGGEGGGRWTGGFIERLVRAGILSLFSSRKLIGLSAKVNQEDLLVLKELIEAGKVTPVIDKTYPLSKAAEAMRHLEQGRARGKVVVTVPSA